MASKPTESVFPPFDRKFFEADEDFTVIGEGRLGGKALGLAAAKRILSQAYPGGEVSGIAISIPRMTVLRTGVFEQFMSQNRLYEVALSDMPDDRIAHAFLKAEFPPLVVGDLRALIAGVRSPLAVRSSSLLEDALNHPFAGVYATKMIPNNETNVGERFRALAEAIKFVWASTFFQDAKSYMRTTAHSIERERMAVIIQEVVGQRTNERYYPVISGVIRTHNYYASGLADAKDGVVNLALGLGKAIVDGGITWSYSPKFPNHGPPFASTKDMLNNTQTRFWAVNMQPASYDPVSEAERLVENDLGVAENDNVLKFIASTYDSASDRLTLGTGVEGPRLLTFAPILELSDIPLNDVIESLSQQCKEALQTDVEIEFALTLDRKYGLPARFGFLQVRPMMVPKERVVVEQEDLAGSQVLVASHNVLGNGSSDSIIDVVYVKPSTFEARHTRAIASELEVVNRRLVEARRRYVLIGFGRWGSSDPWLGIPVTWPQIAGAQAIVEATLPDMLVEASQGSHFFHNMISVSVWYFSVPHTGSYSIDFDWLDAHEAEFETGFVRHVKLPASLSIRVDGRNARGVIRHR